jgi:hypothetical protein
LPENPLLPNRRLKELLELMNRCHALDRRTPKQLNREALLAATAIHLEDGDILAADPADKAAPFFAPNQKPNSLVTWKAVVKPEDNVTLPKVSRLALTAAMAQGLRASGGGGVVLNLTTTSASEPGWADSLSYAQHARLPLLLAVADPTAGRAGRSPNALSLPAVTKAAKKLKLPVLPVDGEDAVAVYRVMQECLLRARLGEGPAVIWGILTPLAKGARLGRSAQPIARMESYLAVRGLLGKKTTRKPRG